MSTPSDRPEPEVEEAFDRLVEEGKQRLERPLLALVATGVLGGIDVGFGILAYLVVRDHTDDTLLAGLAFSIGFVALLLARSELFTENFLVPVTAVVARSGTVLGLARLWAVTLAANLVGGVLIMWILITARPDLEPVAIEVGTHYADLGVTGRSLALAVLAGAVITLMTRMQHATESLGVQLVPAILFGSLLAGAELFHCVLDSLFLMGGWFAGADYGLGGVVLALGWSLLGNVLGRGRAGHRGCGCSGCRGGSRRSAAGPIEQVVRSSAPGHGHAAATSGKSRRGPIAWPHRNTCRALREAVSCPLRQPAPTRATAHRA